MVASYSLIGKYIGARDIEMAKSYRRLLIVTGLVLSITLSSIIFMFRAEIVYALTNIESIRLLTT